MLSESDEMFSKVKQCLIDGWDAHQRRRERLDNEIIMWGSRAVIPVTRHGKITYWSF